MPSTAGSNLSDYIFVEAVAIELVIIAGVLVVAAAAVARWWSFWLEYEQ